MNREIKTLNGVMNLDDSNEVMPFTHHKEARNGVFKGSASEMHFTAIRGNSKVNNGTLAFNDCKLAGSALFTPNCNIEGAAVYIPKCELAGTALLQVNFTLTTSCILNDGRVVVGGMTAGSGVYEIGNLAYATEAIALASTDFTEATSKTFNNMPDGTLWFVIRDKNNISNKLAKSTTIACDGTSTECRDSVSVVISSVPTEVFYQDCCDVLKSVQYTTAGTYTISDCIKGGSLSSPDNGFASFTYSSTTCICPPVDVTANWVDQDYNVCVNCVSYDVYKDTNPNSETAGKYKVNDVVGTTTAPIESVCDTDAEYSESVGTYHVCIGGQVNEYDIYKNTNPCFTGNQYSRGTSGTTTYATNPVNNYPDTDRIMVDKGFNTCYNCVTYPVFRDENSCSPTWNEYFVNDTISLGQTAPIAGDCSTATDWQSLNETTCYECSNQTIYRDYGVCSPTKDKYRIGLTGPVSTTKPAVGDCVTTPTLTAQNYNTCYQCANYAVFRDTNPCSATYNNYVLNQPPSATYINVGNTAPSNGNCVTTADWQNEGARVCIDCTSYQPQRDINPCSATYNSTRNADGVYGAAPCNTTDPSYTSPAGTLHYCTSGTVYTAPVMANTNPCYSGVNTAQFRVDFGGGNYLYYGVGNNPANSYPDTTANWINRPIDQYWECVGNVRYYQQIDINTCSPTAGQTRVGDMDGIVAGYCGYNPTTCTSYEIVNFDSNYDLQVDYIACAGSATTEYVGGGMTMTICAEEGTVSIGGSGSVTDVGSCSV